MSRKRGKRGKGSSGDIFWGRIAGYYKRLVELSEGIRDLFDDIKDEIDYTVGEEAEAQLGELIKLTAVVCKQLFEESIMIWAIHNPEIVSRVEDELGIEANRDSRELIFYYSNN